MPFLSPNQQCQSPEGKISHSMDLLTPRSPGGLPTLSLTTDSSWGILGEGCHASHQPSDASTPRVHLGNSRIKIVKRIHCHYCLSWKSTFFLFSMMRFWCLHCRMITVNKCVVFCSLDWSRIMALAYLGLIQQNGSFLTLLPSLPGL